MNIEQRVSAFIQLGKIFGYLKEDQDWPGYDCGLSEDEFNAFKDGIVRAGQQNGWFTPENVRESIAALSEMLDEQALRKWINEYTFSAESKRIGIVMAGNIPMVGFHDLLCVLISGHKAVVKTASNDSVLLPLVIKTLNQLAPEMSGSIELLSSKMTNYDAVIATGSDNSARYFESYFGHVPNIIRKNRTSIAVLSGNESDAELKMLGVDVFRYFGLGCRNVSKLLIPRSFELDRFFNAVFPFSDVINHHKYANNYDYNKAVYLMNKDELLDNGFILLKEDERLFSPLAMLFYQRYQETSEVEAYLETHQDSIQCVVGSGKLDFGTAQQPGLKDYADGIDTMKFLQGLT